MNEKYILTVGDNLEDSGSMDKLLPLYYEHMEIYEKTNRFSQKPALWKEVQVAQLIPNKTKE